MIKKMIVLFVLITISILPQWQNTWNSTSIDYNTIAGWVSFDKDANNYTKRIYRLDSLSFVIMAQGSSTPEYIYNFSSPEVLAGFQIYSIGSDLNGNGKMDFYILSYYGASPYRQAFKIFDITNGEIIFEKNDPSFYFSYPIVEDINNDGILECLVTKYNYPSFASYQIEVYNTGITGVFSEGKPIKFELKQNYPNPFNPLTNINFYVDSEELVILKIFNLQGELVKVLVNEIKPVGNYQVQWNGLNTSNIKLPSGVYFYQLEKGQTRETKKMILLK